MGRVGNISSDLHRKAGGSGVRAARVSKEITADKLKRPRTGARSTKSTHAKPRIKLEPEPLVITSFDSVWAALGISRVEAASLEARSELMMQIRQIIRTSDWTQAAAAKHCKVSQPRINDLMRGKITKFSIDALINMATALGRRVNFELLAA
jgi:predicted XRE-type DNA-binding protein